MARVNPSPKLSVWPFKAYPRPVACVAERESPAFGLVKKFPDHFPEIPHQIPSHVRRIRTISHRNFTRSIQFSRKSDGFPRVLMRFSRVLYSSCGNPYNNPAVFMNTPRFPSDCHACPSEKMEKHAAISAIHMDRQDCSMDRLAIPPEAPGLHTTCTGFAWKPRRFDQSARSAQRRRRPPLWNHCRTCTKRSGTRHHRRGSARRKVRVNRSGLPLTVRPCVTRRLGHWAGGPKHALTRPHPIRIIRSSVRP